MRSRIQEAFDAVHAEETLKSKTVEFVSNKIAQKESRRNPIRVFAVVTCCLMVVLLGVSGAIYSAPVAAISITTGKSIALSVNSFDRVIGAESYDQDGYASSEYEDLIHMTYDAAVAALLENDEENGIFDEEEPVSISVICEEDSRSNAMQQKIIDCVGGKYGQVECYTASKEELEEAQEIGLPLGKYRAFLEWKALDPEITAEEVFRAWEFFGCPVSITEEL